MTPVLVMTAPDTNLSEVFLNTGTITLRNESIPSSIAVAHKEYLTKGNISDKYETALRFADIGVKRLSKYLELGKEFSDRLISYTPQLNPELSCYGKYNKNFSTLDSYICINPRVLEKCSPIRAAAIINHERFHAFSLNQEHSLSNDLSQSVSGLFLSAKNMTSMGSISKSELLDETSQNRTRFLNTLNSATRTQERHRIPAMLKNIIQSTSKYHTHYYSHTPIVATDHLDEAVTDLLGCTTMTLGRSPESNLNFQHLAKLLGGSSYGENSLKLMHLQQKLNPENQKLFLISQIEGKSEAAPEKLVEFFYRVSGIKLTIDELYSFDLQKVT